MTVTYTPSAARIEELEHGFRWTGKLAAQFVAGSQVDVSLNDAKFTEIGAIEAKAALCSDDPVGAFKRLAVTRRRAAK